MSYTAAHLRSRLLNIVSLSDMIEGSYRSGDLYTTGQLVDGQQQKRKPVLIKRKWNHVVFSRATILSFHPVSMYYSACVCARKHLPMNVNSYIHIHVYIYIYIYILKCIGWIIYFLVLTHPLTSDLVLVF